MKNKPHFADSYFDIVADIVANESDNTFSVKLQKYSRNYWIASVSSKQIVNWLPQTRHSNIELYFYRFCNNNNQYINVTGTAYINGASVISETIELYHPNPDNGINVLINYIRRLKQIRDKFATVIMLTNIIMVVMMLTSIMSMPIKTLIITSYAVAVSCVSITATTCCLYYRIITRVKI